MKNVSKLSIAAFALVLAACQAHQVDRAELADAKAAKHAQIATEHSYQSTCDKATVEVAAKAGETQLTTLKDLKGTLVLKKISIYAEAQSADDANVAQIAAVWKVGVKNPSGTTAVVCQNSQAESKNQPAISISTQIQAPRIIDLNTGKVKVSIAIPISAKKGEAQTGETSDVLSEQPETTITVADLESAIAAQQAVWVRTKKGNIISRQENILPSADDNGSQRFVTEAVYELSN